MPITAIHPGDHLAEELETLNLSAAELARHLKVPTNRITGILMDSAPLLVTQPCALVISLARAPSFG